jgi:hypothetical protein
MSAKKGALADAWDDDWESLADVLFLYLQQKRALTLRRRKK